MPEIGRFFAVLRGHLSPRSLGLVTEWAALHGEELMQGVVAANALGNYRLRLCFEDGVEGVIDLAPDLSFRGVFEPLRDPVFFAHVRVDTELGTVVWPNGADLDPDVLYARVTGTPILREEMAIP